jgi:hypothetical protein
MRLTEQDLVRFAALVPLAWIGVVLGESAQ